MRYKAILMDVDGTLMNIDSKGVPSQRVLNAISKAKKNTNIGIVTARPFRKVMHIFNVLNLSGPSILSDGAQLVNAPYKEFFYERSMDHKVLIDICIILSNNHIKFGIQDDGIDYEFNDTYTPKKPFVITVNIVSREQAQIIQENLPHKSKVSVQLVESSDKEQVGLHITEHLATKQYGVTETAKILNINTNEIIGVGDSGSDIPLLTACGLKVAMANASDELKSIADYIAPSVGNDGIADILEKFVLFE